MMLKEGRVLAAGPRRRGADAGADPRALRRGCGSHAARAHRTPDRRADRDERGHAMSLRAPRRLAVTLLVFGGLAVAAIVLGPLVGSTPISLRARVRPVDPVRRQSSTRRSSSSRGCRERSPARWSARCSRAPASSSRGCCAIRSRRRSRSACRPAPRSARCWRSRSAGRWRGSAFRRRRSPASPVR